LPSRLSAIHYDIEPYNTDEWRAGGDSRRQVQVDYLDFLTSARQHIEASGVYVHFYRALYEKLNGEPPWQE